MNIHGLETIQGLAPIVALATPIGMGAIAVIRLSGSGVIALVNQIFRGKDLRKQPSHTIHFGTLHDATGNMIDEVLVALFIAPHSFTKEDCVEISCHGAPFIVEQIMQLLIQKGASTAEPGAFTKRAFLNGRLDLAQAEAVADLIRADSFLAHQVALQQMRGGFSTEIQSFREQLIHFAAMLELELDFAEEDLAFANREELSSLVAELIHRLTQLIESFQLGNAIKKGLPIVLVGTSNVGKSTLFNALLQEERAIVSTIPGTTRDPIEDIIYLEGIPCRFVDTAGLREQAADEIEAIGIQRTQQHIRQAGLLLYMIDLSDRAWTAPLLDDSLQKLSHWNIASIKIGNKRDIADPSLLKKISQQDFLIISAKNREDVALVKKKIILFLQEKFIRPRDTIVVNARHYESLGKSKEALLAVSEGINSYLTNELLVLELRKALYHLGEITGTITTDDLLTDIFSTFCIGK